MLPANRLEPALKMRTLLGILTVGITITVSESAWCQIVGWFNTDVPPGDNLIAVAMRPQDLDLRIRNLYWDVPEGTTVSLWDTTANDYTASSVYTQGRWSVNLTLDMGMGVKMTSPVAFQLAQVGEVVNPDGSLYQGDYFRNPPLFVKPPGVYLLGNRAPIPSAGDLVYWQIMGRAPILGDRFQRLDAVSQTYITSTYGSGGWDIAPQLRPGEAGFFYVPEPSVTSLLLVGGIMVWRSRRRGPDVAADRYPHHGRNRRQAVKP